MKEKTYKLKIPFKTGMPLTENEKQDLIDHLRQEAIRWSYTHRILGPTNCEKGEKI